MFKNLLTPDFIAELDEELYKEHPDLWDNEDIFYVDGEQYTNILNGMTDRFIRPRKQGEKVTNEYIWRNNRKVWKVGQIYNVRQGGGTKINSTTDHLGDTNFRDEYTFHQVGQVIGQLRLINIIPGNSEKKVFLAEATIRYL